MYKNRVGSKLEKPDPDSIVLETQSFSQTNSKHLKAQKKTIKNDEEYKN